MPTYASQAAIFLSVAIQLQPFLQTFQTDVPLGPFLHSALLSMVKSLQA